MQTVDFIRTIDIGNSNPHSAVYSIDGDLVQEPLAFKSFPTETKTLR